MTAKKPKDIALLPFSKISNKIEYSTYIQQELQEKQNNILHQVSCFKIELKDKEKILEKQQSRFERLKIYIKQEQDGKEQLEATLSQISAPPNIKEKLCNIKGQIRRYKQEEEKLFDTHFLILKTVRDLNASIVHNVEGIIEVDNRISLLKKDVAVQKHGLSKLKLIE